LDAHFSLIKALKGQQDDKLPAMALIIKKSSSELFLLIEK
jgi:hypothetical protein